MKYLPHFTPLCCVAALVLLCALSPNAKSAEITAEQAKEKVEDQSHLNKYFGQEFGGIGQLLGSDNAAADAKLNALISVVEEMKPESADSKALLPRAKQAIDFYQTQLAAAKTPLEDIVKKLSENANDTDSINVYITKQSMSLQQTVASDVHAAEEALAKAKSFISDLKEKETEDASKALLEQGLNGLARFDESIKRSRAMEAMIGKDAAPLAIEAWANGEPMTAEDLKGKVVLLDFWAVWCGPCIATFPHLKHLQEAYGDKGLVILGLTRYYNYAWNEKAKRATRSQSPVEHADEQKMLVEFAKSHELKHRFAVQSDNSMSEYYGVTGIPHVVLLYRQGKVQLMRVGSGPQNGKDVEEKIKELL